MIEYWYSYSVFGFTPLQIFWAIQSWEFFDRGEWPPLIGDERGEYITDEYSKELKKWIQVVRQVGAYTESSITKRRIKTDAYFVKPALITAEIKDRLKTTGEAGEALLDEIWSGMTDVDSLSRPARRALNYISGIRRRKLSYSLWKAQKKYYKSIVMSAKT